MRVLLVSSNSGSAGGGEIYLHYLAIGLARLGHDVEAICSSSSTMDKLAKKLGEVGSVRRVQITNTYNRPIRSLGAVIDAGQQRRLRRVFQENRPDVLHLNQQVAEDGLDLLLAARKARLPFLSTIYITQSARELEARLGRTRDRLTAEVLRRVNSTHITVSKHARGKLIERFNFLKPQQVPVVTNGVRFDEPNSDLRDSIRAQWGVGPGEILLGSVGRLVAQKSPVFALDVVAALIGRGLKVRYVWIGDGVLREKFLSQAHHLGIAGRVRLEGWREDAGNCFKALDLLVMPSIFEGMPLALLEAMAAGLCCCVSQIDGMAEVIEDGVTGVLCPPSDFKSWCGQLATLIREPNLRVAIGNNARADARQRFGLESMARNTIGVYEYVKERQIADH